MFYQAYQRVGKGTADCTRTSTRPRVLRQGRTRYKGIFPRAYLTYQNDGYGWGSRTKLTKVSGTGMDTVPNLPKDRVRVWMLYEGCQRVRYGYTTCLVKGRVRVLRLYQAYQRVEYLYRCRTKLAKSRVRVRVFYQAYQRDGYCTAGCTRTSTRPRVFQQGRTRYQGIFPRAYLTYQSNGYGWGSRTKLTKVSCTGMDTKPNPPKGRVRVWMLYQAYQGVGYGNRCGTKLIKR